MSNNTTKTVESTEIIRETKDIRVTVLKLSEDAKRGLSTEGAHLRTDSDSSQRRSK